MDRYNKVRKRLSKIKRDIKQRTTNPKNPRYALYGGRGVRMIESWNNLDTFIKDVTKLDGYSEELLLQGKIVLDKDRKGNSLLYSPETCVWLSREENNKIKPNQQKPFYVYTKDGTLVGEFINQSDAAAKLNLSQGGISYALHKSKSHTYKGYTFKLK
jgi:NUMOD1 domain